MYTTAFVESRLGTRLKWSEGFPQDFVELQFFFVIRGLMIVCPVLTALVVIETPKPKGRGHAQRLELDEKPGFPGQDYQQGRGMWERLLYPSLQDLLESLPTTPKQICESVLGCGNG